jgi:hypothetical protein
MGLSGGPYFILILIHKGVLFCSVLKALLGRRHLIISRSAVRASIKPEVFSKTPGSV